MNDYWHKQTTAKPLFSNLLWSRPENRQLAGKLLIFGGNVHGFAAPATAYQTAMAAGVGVARVLLPDALQKTVGRVFEAGEFAPSTPSGSFSQKALAELLDLSQWADGVLACGDLGRNSETAIVLEAFAKKYSGQLTLTKDAADYSISTPQTALARPDTLLVLSLAQLQKLAIHAGSPKAVTFGMSLLHLVDFLHEFSQHHPLHIIVKHLDNLFVAVNGQVSTTTLSVDMDIWRVAAATHASVWWLQNPSKSFEALTTAAYEIARQQIK